MQNRWLKVEGFREFPVRHNDISARRNSDDVQLRPMIESATDDRELIDTSVAIDVPAAYRALTHLESLDRPDTEHTLAIAQVREARGQLLDSIQQRTAAIQEVEHRIVVIQQAKAKLEADLMAAIAHRLGSAQTSRPENQVGTSASPQHYTVNELELYDHLGQANELLDTLQHDLATLRQQRSDRDTIIQPSEAILTERARLEQKVAAAILALSESTAALVSHNPLERLDINAIQTALGESDETVRKYDDADSFAFTPIDRMIITDHTMSESPADLTNDGYTALTADTTVSFRVDTTDSSALAMTDSPRSAEEILHYAMTRSTGFQPTQRQIKSTRKIWRPRKS